MKTKKTIIPVILSADNNYAPYMYVTMFSMLEHAATETFYDFFLMVPSVFSDENTKKINSLKNKYKCDVHFIDMKDAFSDLKMQIGHITSPTYYRLLAGDLLPKHYDKCIYLDVDTVVCADLSELFSTKLGNNYVAAANAPGYYFDEMHHCSRLGLPNMRSYINAGVLLMNLAKIRKDNKTAEFMELSKKNYSSQDQDVINVACYGKIKLLPPKYNALTYRLKENNPKLKKLFKEKDIKDAINNPVIIHYADKVKPWQNPQMFMAQYWWQSAAKSSDYDFNSVRYFCPELIKWFKRSTGTDINLDKPKTFNEKIQWLKLYDSTPDKTRLADKFLVRDWVKENIGEKYLMPLIGVYDSFDEIDFETLPDKFVMKCNHGSGWNMVVTDKSKLNVADAKQKFDKWMMNNYAFSCGCELHYRDITPKIIIEKYVENDGGKLYDYKFWCFNGQVKYMQFRDDYSRDLKMVFYDTKWKKQLFYYDHPLYDNELEKPNNYDEMIAIAQKLCKGFAFVCVDLYRLNDGTILFGEMTFTRSSGTGKWNDNKYNLMMGNLIKLPKKAYNIDTGEYYELPKDFHKQFNITPTRVKPAIKSNKFYLFGFVPLFSIEK